jgi:hypothetical protein
MRRAFIWLSIFGSVIISAASGSPIAAQELSEARCHALLAELQPSGDEAWRTIPWKIDLLDAQRSAAKRHKPIFIWAMDGHPLGCT